MGYRLPIFPLGVVLFPGTPLPLHIFEPRYRQLLADCLAETRPFGITPPGAADETPPPGTAGCVAQIHATHDLPDGRSNVVVVGGTRFRVLQTVEESVPYHVALVEDFDEEAGTDPPPEALAMLRQLFSRYFEGFRRLNDVEPAEAPLAEDAVDLSFQVAAAIQCDASVKQLLLTTRSTRERVTVLVRLLPLLTAAVESAVTIHQRAPTNGTGGPRPDISAL